MDLAEDLRSVLVHIDREGIDHMLVGALALEALGVPRSTLDVDIQVALDPAPTLLDDEVLGWRIQEHGTDRVFGQDTVIVQGPVSGVPIELFVTSHWFTRQALDRKQRIHSEILELDVPVPTSEDFILLKLAHMVHTSRHKRKANQDGLDIEGVVQASRDTLDRTYLRENAKRLGLAEALEEFLA